MQKKNSDVRKLLLAVIYLEEYATQKIIIRNVGEGVILVPPARKSLNAYALHTPD